MTTQRRFSRMALATLALAVPLLVALPPLTASPAAAARALPSLVVNEVDANGAPEDWIELKNTGATPVDASGLILKDDKDSHRFDIPSGTIIAAGDYAAFDVAGAFGLGKGGDSARLYLSDNTTLVDSFTWTSNSAPTTWGRCPDSTGAFALTATITKGATNDCATGTTPPTMPPITPPTTPPTTTPPPGMVPGALAWPGSPDVSTANTMNFFGSNLSGLSYQLGTNGAADTLWAVRNGPSTLYSLQKSGTDWVPSNTNDWGNGKALRFTDGTGDPDAEGITQTPDGIFVSTERNNDNSKVSRPTILKFDQNATGTTLTATVEWNLTADLPALGANLGAEGITFVPDTHLTARGFVDEKTGSAYDPANYAHHGAGLFFVGIEGNGTIYAYALDQTDGSQFTRVATIASGFSTVVEVHYDPEKSAIWAACDNACGGQYALLDVAQTGSDLGHFAVSAVYNRPAGLGDFNNEGFVTAPQALCTNGAKPVIWADDDEDDGYSLREGTIDCAEATPAAPGDTTGNPGTTAGSETLAETGAEPIFAAAAALMLLIAGGILIVVRRRRVAA